MDLLELVEHAQLIDGRDPDPRVDHLHEHPGARSGRAHDLRVARRGDDSRPQDDAAVRRELDRVGNEIHDDLPELARVGGEARQARTDAERESQSALDGERLHLGRHVEEEIAHVDRLAVELHATRGQPRKVEDLVHQVAQVCGRALDPADGRLLSGGERAIRAIAQEFGEAHDRVQRRAEFV